MLKYLIDHLKTNFNPMKPGFIIRTPMIFFWFLNMILSNSKVDLAILFSQKEPNVKLVLAWEHPALNGSTRRIIDKSILSLVLTIILKEFHPLVKVEYVKVWFIKQTIFIVVEPRIHSKFISHFDEEIFFLIFF